MVFARASVRLQRGELDGEKREGGKKKNAEESQSTDSTRQQTNARTKTVCGRRANLVTRNAIYTAPTTTAPPQEVRTH